ncbi:glutamyl-tRNA reductase [Actinomyces timonensis]|uniref:Glutamyl-tRNA reductase n=1 Tax=Actinomyces timonensis TaxID=1288391 RepID=A0AAU8N5A4_9ACTO
MTIHLLSADHLSQGLDVVARLGVNPRRLGPDILAAVPGLRGVLVLATCNRLAVLLDEPDGAVTPPRGPGESSLAVREASALLERRAGMPEGSAGLSAVRGVDAYRELIATAAGLRSMVVGEREIAGQLRRSLVRAAEEGTVSADLCRLVERASAASRRVARETALAGAGRSLVAVGLGLAAQRMPALEGARVVVVGTGAYAGATVAALRDRGVRDIAVHSHSGARAAHAEGLAQGPRGHGAGTDRATAFARKRGLAVVGPHELPDCLAGVDLVITCRGLGSPVITRGLIDDALSRRRAARERASQEAAHPLVILDLALSRDVDPGVADAPGALLIDLPRIRQAVPAAQTAQVEAAEAIVAEEAGALDRLMGGRRMDPVIRALRGRAEDVVAREAARLRPVDGRVDLDDAVRALERLAAALMHAPSQAARAAGESGRAQDYLTALSMVLGGIGVPDSPAPRAGGAR